MNSKTLDALKPKRYAYYNDKQGLSRSKKNLGVEGDGSTGTSLWTSDHGSSTELDPWLSQYRPEAKGKISLSLQS